MVKPTETVANRAQKRKRVLMTVILFTPDGALKVRLRDLSSTGAHVVADIRMLSDCDALLKKGPLFVAARVVWTKDKEAGLKFYRELSDKEIGLHQVLSSQRGSI